MKAKVTQSGYDMYFRASSPKAHKRVAGKRHHVARAHTRKIHHARIFGMPDEQMPEPPVVPKDERHIWH